MDICLSGGLPGALVNGADVVAELVIGVDVLAKNKQKVQVSK